MARHLYTGGRWRRWIALTAVLTLASAALLLRARDPAPAVLQVPAATPAERPVLYVDPLGAAAREVRDLRRRGRPDEAEAVRRIAGQPVATWLTDSRAATLESLDQLVTAATEAERVPVLVLYNIPQRDCSGQSAGGARDATTYRKWVFDLALVLRGHRALVILEPDAVAHAATGCLSRKRAAERYRLLAGAVDALRALPGVRVYLDAGNPTWVPVAAMAPALRRSGALHARGLALNVANFETTKDNLRYGTELSRLLGNAHFVIDTSRNGNGPARPGAGDQHWCNPPGRRLGVPPTLRTGNPLADAYLWIKRPGESDGACGGDAPPAGQWYPSYALALAR
ncbi:glycoside hydrolase family 6 protein [Actinoplanes sp. L3-i22]|uniref:glycoside hydrolase family 6 protein n=1 Tax=Actinoplanes sp. L3-i22 TaxID=2836373 RepID=UPI001C754BB9|nr:glycoside hydrolase family 6 protein [Actinoplanes sp. L3-i22]BCY05695.1 glucanase [Actinoplanes sp. L3-i22]